jgi:hypothetical protein
MGAMKQARALFFARCALAVALALYVASMFLPTFCRQAGACNDSPGYSALLIGWFEVFLAKDVGPFVALAWLANPLFIAAAVMLALQKYRPAALCSLLALLLGALFQFGTNVVANEGGVANTIVGYGSGYWIWLSSTAVLCIACLIGGRIESRVGPHESQRHGA